MKIGLRKTSVLTLTAVFFISAALCCCLTKTAQADESAVPACHKTTQSKKSSHDANDCDCCKSKIQADHSIKTSLDIKPSVLVLATLSVASQLNLVVQDEPLLAYLNDPPGPVSDTPLYISLHNFRI